MTVSKEEQAIRSMEFHQKLSFGDWTILRVVGGWIYTYQRKVHCNSVGDQFVATSTFVPEMPIQSETRYM